MKWRRILIGLVSAACVALAAGATTASPARADSAPTSTALTLSSSTAYSGVEDLDPLSVDVGGGNGNPAGSFGVSTGQTVVCSGTLTNGSGTCDLAPSQFSPGTYQLTAVYSGDENSGASASNTVSLTVVAQQTTTTTLTQSTPTVTYDQQQTDQFNVQVSPALAGIAAGTVTITAGSTTLCTITLDIGPDRCTATTLLPVGSYQVIATYGGGSAEGHNSSTLLGSASAPQTLTILARQPTITTLTLSAPTINFGGEQAETLTVTVRSTTSGTPTGIVNVIAPKLGICSITLSGGTGTCTLTASQLAIGSYQIGAEYEGDSTYDFSSDGPQTLTVANRLTTTNLAVSADTVAHGSEQAELFTVQVVPGIGGTPTGNVTVKAGSVAVCTIILTNATGNCFLTKSQLKIGTYQITATYNGDAAYAVSTSTPPQTINVVAK
jgi:hypothetical protein